MSRVGNQLISQSVIIVNPPVSQSVNQPSRPYRKEGANATAGQTTYSLHQGRQYAILADGEAKQPPQPRGPTYREIQPADPFVDPLAKVYFVFVFAFVFVSSLWLTE